MGYIILNSSDTLALMMAFGLMATLGEKDRDARLARFCIYEGIHLGVFVCIYTSVHK